MDVPASEDYPEDQYAATREEKEKPYNPSDKEFKRYMEYSFKGRHCGYTKAEQQQIQQFLLNDRKVLRFYCSWDDRDSLYGDFRLFVSSKNNNNNNNHTLQYSAWN